MDSVTAQRPTSKGAGAFGVRFDAQLQAMQTVLRHLSGFLPASRCSGGSETASELVEWRLKILHGIVWWDRPGLQRLHLAVCRPASKGRF